MLRGEAGRRGGDGGNRLCCDFDGGAHDRGYPVLVNATLPRETFGVGMELG